MDSTQLNGRIPVPWTTDPAAKASAIIDALVRCGAGLVYVADAVYLPDDDGLLAPFGRDALQRACGEHLVFMRAQNIGTAAVPSYKITYEPINELDVQTVHNVLAGVDRRTGEPLKSGTIASWVPRLTV